MAVIGSIGLIAFLAIWEGAVGSGLIDAFFLPPPSAVLKRMIQLSTGPDAVLIRDIRVSAVRVLIGFVLSALEVFFQEFDILLYVLPNYHGGGLVRVVLYKVDCLKICREESFCARRPGS